ncbi:hypothetical protein [Methylobacterium oxalidis]|uniref:hypothetical protein n=1 Tax=Methylobacterium oxalidis TaxID=944322 RepID=UPI003315E345
MTVMIGLAAFVLVVAALLSGGRPAAFLGCLCLLGLGCVIAVSSLRGLARSSAPGTHGA